MTLHIDRNDVPSKKKIFYPIQKPLRNYLIKFEREADLPIQYSDMLRFNLSTPLLDKNGKDTLWKTVYYDESEMKELYAGLKYIYAIMHAAGRLTVMNHLSVARIDYCSFGNSKPFRVRIINRLNDNYDHFYVKRADASRIYGLELEHILSPNRINYITNKETLIEEHIPGLPGDVFVDEYINDVKFNQTRISKEFVKFNERCFVRLLGDMRSYNFVVEITPDIEGNQYRIRAIDFDQQSYEGRLKLYLPQYFKENNNLVFLGMDSINEQSMKQYQQEERSIISHRVKLGRYRLRELFEASLQDEIAPLEKTLALGQELANYHQDKMFTKIRHMGHMVKAHLYACLVNRVND
ncbi:hypothetical protein BCY91_03870 [Pelobium manganitolerans]|uniref:Uncharacterized protein n=1 Tax=Pelobium manganitolerans TaxID=1842495 RepID=A0A419S7Y6_9SPHI|nr:hypothetical protein [Pelobium manganitolerans]RKD17276.1 hypothetical protein BCY91_03870 [Pelobium manganitolerans]